MKRAQKIALLSDLLNGKASRPAIGTLKRENEVWTFVVCSNGMPALTDLVDTRLPDEKGRSRVPYGEFLKNPMAYGQHCITID